jgi:hypothetical protein
MAAAIAVLVIVGGVLALVFHNQSNGNQGGIAGGGTPSAVEGAQLPLTVTANGVAVELERVDSSSDATRFSFMIRLAPGQLGAHGFCCALGPDPSTYLSIEGITPAPGDPYGSESDGGSNPPIIRFSLQYQSPFPTDRTVTLTIKRLGIPPPPGTPTTGTPTGDQAPNTSQVEGPWTFKITPEMVDHQPTPTPFATNARFAGLSVESAQKLTSFTIVAPSPLPTVLTQGHTKDQNEFNVIGFGLGVPASAKANYVLFNYAQAFGGPVRLIETTNPDGVPRVNGTSATIVSPLTPDRSETLMIKTGSSSTVNIDGVAVNRFEVNDANNSEIYYVWTIGNVHCSIQYIDSPGAAQLKRVGDNDLRQMATSIIKQGASDGAANSTAPVAAAAPNRFGSYDKLSLAQAEQLVNFPIATPNPLPDVLKPLPNNTITASAIGSTGATKANFIFFFYPAVNMAEKGVSVVETSADSAVPTVQGNAIHWIDPTGRKTTVAVSQVTQTSLTIAGQTVNRWDTVQQGANVVYYLWDRKGVHFVVYTIPKIQVTEAVMEQFVHAMIAPSAAPQRAQPSPTPPFALPTPDADGQIVLTFEQARQITPFFVATPQWVPDYLTDQGVIVPEWQGAEPPGSLVQEIMLTYLNPEQRISVQITEEGEHVPRAFANAATPTTLTIAGQSVTRTDIVSGSETPIRDYLWQEHGTTFELTGTITDPLTEQDLEHMIASMIEQGT